MKLEKDTIFIVGGIAVATIAVLWVAYRGANNIGRDIGGGIVDMATGVITGAIEGVYESVATSAKTEIQTQQQFNRKIMDRLLPLPNSGGATGSW